MPADHVGPAGGADGPLRHSPPPSAVETAIVRWSSYLGRASLAVMFIVIAMEIVAREGFDRSLQLSDELGGYLLVAVAFLGLPLTLRYDGFNRAEFLVDILPRGVQFVLDVLFQAIALAFSLIVTLQAMRLVYLSFAAAELSLTMLRVPLWIPQLPMAIGMALLTVGLAMQLLRTIALQRESRASSGKGK